MLEKELNHVLEEGGQAIVRVDTYHGKLVCDLIRQRLGLEFFAGHRASK